MTKEISKTAAADDLKPMMIDGVEYASGVSTASAIALPAGFDYLGFLQWSLKNATKIPAMMAAASAVWAEWESSHKAVPTWEKSKLLGDLAAPMIDELVAFGAHPTVVTVSVASSETDIAALEAKVVAKVKALGSDKPQALAFTGERLKKLWALLGPMLPLLLPYIMPKAAMASASLAIAVAE